MKILGWWVAFALILLTSASQAQHLNSAGQLVIEICGAGNGASDCNSKISGASDIDSMFALPVPLGSAVGSVNVGTNGSVAKIPIDPSTKLPTPSGWTPPGVGSILPLPPGTASVITSYNFGSLTGFGSAGAACTAGAAAQAIGDIVVSSVLLTGMTCTFRVSSASGGYSNILQTMTIGSSSSCPAGYTAGGGLCNLSNPSVVPKPADTKCGLILLAHSIGVDPNDPDCAAPAGNLVASGSEVNAGSATNSLRVEYAGDGSSKVTVSTVGASGNTHTTVINLGAPGSAPGGGSGAGNGAATVTGVSSSITPGSGTGTTPDPGSTAECGVPGKPVCNVRIDETGVTKGEGAFTAPTATVEGTKGSLEAAMDAHKNPVLPWSWSFSLPSLSCSTWSPSFTVGGVSRSMTVNWCGALGVVRTLWAWFISIFTAVYVWRSFSTSLWR